MDVNVKIQSRISKRVVHATYTGRQLLDDFIDEADLIQDATACNCQPIGETYVVDCRCGDEWEDCNVWIGDETKGDE